ncbi:hypothetical protein [Alkalibacter mobilis]|uniref:hypothetical protein n=1 Tax=Alkalibacter mobilis TaxID=2787712 RepID=UPI00189D5D42|nr:hypothetical protein [Alkalibacter mobilis]MBF7096100.1 hypothetical protein [Alkalibacter mobilis]
MGIKAKEVIRRDSMSVKALLFIMALLIGFQYGYAFIIERADESYLTWITGAATAISLAITFVIIRKIVPWYQVELVDKKLVVSKSMFVKPRKIREIPVSEIVEIKTINEIESLKGKKIDYTIFGIKEKSKYFIVWNNKGKNTLVMLQLSEGFLNKVNKEIERTKKVKK